MPHRLLCLLTSVLLCAGCALQRAPLQADPDAPPAPPSARTQPTDAETGTETGDREVADEPSPQTAAGQADAESADPLAATAVDGNDSGNTVGRNLSPRQRAQVQFQVMAGEMAAGRDQPGLASEAFLRALELVPDAELAARTTQLALGAGRFDVGEAAARRWLEIDPTALEAREVLARLALQSGAEQTLYEHARAIIYEHPGGPEDGFRHVALLLSADAENGDAVLRLMDRLVAGAPELAGAHYARALVALRQERLELAEAAARQALALRPDSRDYTLLLIGVLTRDDRAAQADPLAQGLLAQAENDAQRGEIHMTYARLLLDAGSREHARRQIESALGADPENHDARYALGIMSMTDGDLDQAERFFMPLTRDGDRGGDAWYQLGRIAEARGNSELALEHYRKVVTGSQAIEAAVRQAAVMTQLGRVDEGRGLLEQLRRQFPPLGPRLTRAEAEMLVEANLDSAALGIYETALENAPDDPNLLYGRSLVYEKLGRFPEAERDLRAILEHDPDNPRALNALGYMLTVNTDRYKEARKLIESALRQEPDDAAVIDSMGWVLFKLGEAEAARGYLERALAMADDPEISAHLGEVLWSLGERDRARTIWDQALSRDPGHRVLRETVDRLTR